MNVRRTDSCSGHLRRTTILTTLALLASLAGCITMASTRPFNSWLLVRSPGYLELFHDVPFWEGSYALLVRTKDGTKLVNESRQPYWMYRATENAALIGVIRGDEGDDPTYAFEDLKLEFGLLHRGERKISWLDARQCPSAVADPPTGDIICVRCDDPRAPLNAPCSRMTVSRFTLDGLAKSQRQFTMPEPKGKCRQYSFFGGHPIIIGLRNGAPVVKGDCEGKGPTEEYTWGVEYLEQVGPDAGRLLESRSQVTFLP